MILNITNHIVLGHILGRSFTAALLPQMFWKNPRSHHKGATGRVRMGDQLLSVLSCAIANLDKTSQCEMLICRQINLSLRNLLLATNQYKISKIKAYFESISFPWICGCNCKCKVQPLTQSVRNLGTHTGDLSKSTRASL